MECPVPVRWTWVRLKFLVSRCKDRRPCACSSCWASRQRSGRWSCRYPSSGWSTRYSRSAPSTQSSGSSRHGTWSGYKRRNAQSLINKLDISLWTPTVVSRPLGGWIESLSPQVAFWGLDSPLRATCNISQVGDRPPGGRWTSRLRHTRTDWMPLRTYLDPNAMYPITIKYRNPASPGLFTFGLA